MRNVTLQINPDGSAQVFATIDGERQAFIVQAIEDKRQNIPTAFQLPADARVNS